GKSILLSREAIDEIGGFSALRDYLAEDYLLGKLVEGAGFRVRLSADEIETTEFSKSLAAVWSRQRRWAILRGGLGGLSYFGELFTSPFLWAAGAIATRGPWAFAPVLLLYAARIVAETVSAADAGRPLELRNALLMPLRDAAVAALFWAGLFGR